MAPQLAPVRLHSVASCPKNSASLLCSHSGKHRLIYNARTGTCKWAIRRRVTLGSCGQCRRAGGEAPTKFTSRQQGNWFLAPQRTFLVSFPHRIQLNRIESQRRFNWTRKETSAEESAFPRCLRHLPHTMATINIQQRNECGTNDFYEVPLLTFYTCQEGTVPLSPQPPPEPVTPLDRDRVPHTHRSAHRNI